VIAARTLSVRTVLGVVISIELIVLYFVLRNNSWVFDDNFLLVRAGQEGFNWHWLTQVEFEHWDIGEHLVISLQHRLFFFDYRWALVTLLAVFGGCIYVFERILATIVKNRWVTIAAAAWFGLNVLWVRPLQWATAGIQYFPYTLLDLLCLYGFMRYYANRDRRWLAVSVISLAAALLFYEKPAYILIYLALVRVLLMSESLKPVEIAKTFWRERLVWGLYVAVVLIWGIGYLHAKAYGTHGPVTLGEYLSYFRIFWLQTLVPSLASVTIPAFKLSTLQIVFVVVSQIAVLSCVIVSVRRKRSAWRAWIFFAVIVILSAVLVAHSRVAQFGVGIANDPRYLIDFGWLAPLTLCAAFGRGKVLAPAAPQSDAQLGLPTSRLAAPTLAGVAVLVAYGGGSIATGAQLQRVWPGAEARTWEQNVRRDFARVRRSSAPVVIADNATPFAIMESFVAPYNRLSRVLPMYVGPLQVDGPIDGATLDTIGLDGSIHHANVVPLDSGGTVVSLERSRQLEARGGREVRAGSQSCFIADGTSIAVERHLAKPPTVGDAPYYLLLTYRAWAPVAPAVFVNAGSGFPGSPENAIALRGSRGTSIAWLGPNSPHDLLLTIPPLTTICVERFDVVTLRDSS
jgi:hypothetical protein